jgi:hypothetical protein
MINFLTRFQSIYTDTRSVENKVYELARIIRKFTLQSYVIACEDGKVSLVEKVAFSVPNTGTRNDHILTEGFVPKATLIKLMECYMRGHHDRVIFQDKYLTPIIDCDPSSELVEEGGAA